MDNQQRSSKENVQRLESVRLVAPSGAKCQTPEINLTGWRYSLD